MKMEKAVMLINDTTYAFNLRGAVIEKLIDEDFEVVIVGQLLKHQDMVRLQPFDATVVAKQLQSFYLEQDERARR